MNVILAVDEQSCLRYLDRQITLSAGAEYVSFFDLSLRTTARLQQVGFQKGPALAPLAAGRDQVLREYVELIGDLNARMSSVMWWATDFSSKNRFNSHLPDILHKFLLTVERLKDPPTAPLLIIGLPWQARSTMGRILKQKGLAHEFIGYGQAEKAARANAFWRKILSLGFHGLRLMGRRCYVKWTLRSFWPTPYSRDKKCYVIKSFLYDHSFDKDGGYRDAFFGPLPQFLKDAGEDVVFFVNVLGDLPSCVKKISRSLKAKIIVLESCSSLWGIIVDCVRALCYSPKIKGECRFSGHEISDIVRNELVTSGRVQLYQLLHYRQTKNMLKKLDPAVFLTTYENNPWEKMCFMALRQASAKTEIIGYQHTVNPPASVNMFISAKEEGVIPKPDLVLTVGEIPQEIIVKYTQAVSLAVEPACALRFEQLLALTPVARTQTQKILLALEGIFEVYQMVNYVLEQLRGQKEYKLLIRCHPVLPVKAFAHKLRYRLSDLPFVEISRGQPLIKDIERTDLTIYWGSTVALETLWMGKPVIHFDMETLFSYDPLFDCPHLKWTTTPRQALLPIIEQTYDLPDIQFQTERSKAQEYLKRYFYPVGPRNLAKFLPAK